MMRALAAWAGIALAGVTSTAWAQEDLANAREPHARLPAAARERDPDRLGWYVPDFARVQTGGFVGMLVVGTGYAIASDVVNWSIHYGFTPAAHAGSDVHAFSSELLVRPLDFRIASVRWIPLYAGPGLLYAWGDGFFTRLPDRYERYDSSYYPPTSLHWTLRAGSELDYLPQSGPFERHGIFYEVTLLDTYFARYRDNPDRLDFDDALAGALGYRAAF